MIELIPGLPDNTVGFTATGKVTGADYEHVIIPEIDEKLKKHDKIRLLYHCGDQMTGFDAAAAWDDTKVGLKHMTSWERIAVVTDEGWIANSVKAFGFLMPALVKIYPNAELEKAKAWVSS